MILSAFIIPFVLLALAFPFVLAVFAFWIWMLVSAIQNKGLSEGEKVAWVLGVVFLHMLGAILYFFVGRSKRRTPLASA